MPNQRDIDHFSRKLAAEEGSETATFFNYQSIAPILDPIPRQLLDAIATAAPTLRAHEKGLPLLLSLTVTVSAATWQSIRFLTFPQPEAGWQPGFIYSVTPLARTLIDALLNVVYLFDEPGKNARWFLISGWFEQTKEFKRIQAAWGTDPTWSTWFELAAADIKQTEDELVTPTPDERQRERAPKAGWWPNPGSMVKKHPAREPLRRDFISYLNDRVYGHLSADSHLSLQGLLRRGGHNLPLAEGLTHEMLHMRASSKFSLDALALYVALLSELSSEFHLSDTNASLLAIWDLLLGHDLAASLLSRRYATSLR